MSKVPVNKLMTLAAAASGSAIAATFLGPDVAGCLAGVAGGIFQNLFAGLLQPTIEGDGESPESRILNEDLRHLVGEAIRDTILLHGSDSSVIRQLASSSISLWTSESTASDTAYARLDEKAAVELFNTASTDFSKLRALDTPTWRRFIDTLVSCVPCDISESLRDRLASSLYERLPQMLRSKIKQDFEGTTETQGRAFASLHLAMMGRLIQGVETLVNRPQESDTLQCDLLEHLKKFSAAASSHVQRYGKNARLPHERAGVSRLMEQVNLLRPRIERRLNDVLRAIGAEGERSRRRHLVTHRHLTWLAGGVLVVVLGMIGMYTRQSRTNASLEQIEAQLRTALKPKMAGDAVIQEPLPPALIEKAKLLRDRGNQEQRALAEIALGHYESANDMIQLLKKEPLSEMYRWFALEGDNWFRARQYDRAIEPYEKALMLKSNDVGLLNDLAMAHSAAKQGSLESHRVRALSLLTQADGLCKHSDQIWITVQINLAVAHGNSPVGDRKAHLEKGITILEAVLTVCTRENNPSEWARAHFNLGTAWGNLPVGEHNATARKGGGLLTVTNLKKALQEYELALTVLKPDEKPNGWALAQVSLGAGWRQLSMIENQSANLEKAIQAFQAALLIYHRDTFPDDWAGIQHDLGLSWGMLPTGNRNQNLEKAITAFQNALSVYDRGHETMLWASAQEGLGAAWGNLSTGDRSSNVEKSLKALQEALTVYTRQDNPFEWARTQMNIGNAWAVLVTGDQGANLRKAIGHSKAATVIYTPEAFPREHEDAMSFQRQMRYEYESHGYNKNVSFDAIEPAQGSQ